MRSLCTNLWKRRVLLHILPAAVAVVCGLITPGYAQEYKQIVIATGSPFELGLIDELAKAFQKSHGGVVRCIKTPTGRALNWGDMA